MVQTLIWLFVALLVLLVLVIAFVPSTGVPILERLRARLVDDWHRAWRWFSMQAMAAAGMLEVLEMMVRKEMVDYPPALMAVLPPSALGWMSMGALLLGIGGRLVKQKSAEVKP